MLRQQALQNRILSLEEERTQLCDNNPCPLCGSLDHPYAHENIPDLRKVDEQLNEAKHERKNWKKPIMSLLKRSQRLKQKFETAPKSKKKNSNY